MIKILGFIIF